MSAVGTRHIEWQGGEHDFCLSAVGNLLSLEEKCGFIGVIYHRLGNGLWGINDVREPIRLGLIGGGLPAEKAMELVKVHVDANPNGYGPSAVLALALIETVIIGVPKDDPVGKQPAPDAKTQAPVSSTTTAASGAQPSTGSAPA